jgi:hypothetical protein
MAPIVWLPRFHLAGARLPTGGQMHVTDLRNPTFLLSLDVDTNVTRKSRHISAAVFSQPWSMAVKFHAVVVIEARTHDGQLSG